MARWFLSRANGDACVAKVPSSPLMTELPMRSQGSPKSESPKNQKRWDVQTDQGWMPFAPGIYFHGFAGEEVEFQMGATRYKAKFYSKTSGIQINLSTHKQRLLRRHQEHISRFGYDIDEPAPSAVKPSAIKCREHFIFNRIEDSSDDDTNAFDVNQSDSTRSISLDMTPSETLRTFCSAGMNHSDTTRHPLPKSCIKQGEDSRSALAPRAAFSEDLMFGIRVVKAELFHCCAASKKMSPFAVVELHPAEGTSKEITRTLKHNNGHLNPTWAHTTEQPFACSKDDDVVEFKVYDGGSSVLASPVFCGAASIGVAEFLSGAVIPINQRRHSKSGILELQLYNGSGQVGTITVQAFIFKSGLAQELLDRTILEADPQLFEATCSALGVSGGTARFYQLFLRDSQASKTHYIGKDLQHARDEILFYEDAAQLLKQSNQGGMGMLLRFMLDYAGTLTCDMDSKTVQLLVLENMRDRCSTLRLLDLKIGQRTADAGWQGKSRLAALRASLVDGVTNSSAEGYRLEGFDSPPVTLTSMNPLLDLGELGKKIGQKKVFRFMLQKMCCSEVLMHFLDLNAGEGLARQNVSFRVSSAEVAEIVLNEVAHRLVFLALSCRDCPVPQKWVGSSVAIGFDSDCFPSRTQPEDEIRKRVKVNIFDWGRSELNTLEKHMCLSSSEQQDRAKFWSYYIGGIDRLAWEISRMYWHRFGNAKQWQKPTIKVLDFDSGFTRDGVLGQVHIQLKSTPAQCVTLCNADGSAIVGNSADEPVTVTYSVEHRIYPSSSRLREGWLVRLLRASNLPRCSALLRSATPDAYATLTAYGEDDREFQQQTCVVSKSFDPIWEASFEIPVAARDDFLSRSLQNIPLLACRSCGWSIPVPMSETMFPPESADNGQVEASLGRWITTLDGVHMQSGGHAQGCTGMQDADSDTISEIGFNTI